MNLEHFDPTLWLSHLNNVVIEPNIELKQKQNETYAAIMYESVSIYLCNDCIIIFVLLTAVLYSCALLK